MSAFNATFSARLDARQNQPCWVVGDATVASIGGNWSYYHGVIPSGAPGSSNWKPYLKRLSTGRTEVNPRDGKLTVPTMTLEILATADHFLQKVVATEQGATPSSIGKPIALFMGYRDIAFSSWVRLFVGNIRDLTLSADGTYWQVSVVPFIGKCYGEVMTKATGNDRLLNGDLDSWDSGGAPNDWTRTIAVGGTVNEDGTPSNQRDTAGNGSAAKFAFDGSGNTLELKQIVTGGQFLAATYYTFEIWAKAGAVGLPFKIGVQNNTTTNWLTVSGTTVYNNGGTWGGGPAYLACTPGNGVYARTLIKFKTEAGGPHTLTFYLRGSDAALANATIYIDDVSVTTKVVVQGHPLDIVSAMIGALGTTQGGTGQVCTWLGGEPTAIGLSTSYNSVIHNQYAGYQVKAERDDWYPGQVIEATFLEPVKALSWIEDEILRLWGFVFTNVFYEVCFKGYHPAQPPSAPETYDQAITLAVPRWSRRIDLMTNRIVIRGDYDSKSNEYKAEFYRVEDTGSIAAEGPLELLISSRILRTELNGVALAAAMGGRLWQKLFRCPEQIVASLPMSKVDTIVGDEIQITDPNLPNLITGARGKTSELFQVWGVDADFFEGKVEALMIRSSYSKPGFIAPNGTPDFTSASAVQKQLAFVSTTGTYLMSDGSNGYVVE